MTERTFTVLVVGGYGVFGERVCRLLAGDPAIRLIVGGRSAERAEALAAELRSSPGGGRVEAARLDASADFGAALRRTGARLVIHAAGPFQGQDYAVARACIDNGAHYIDLADATGFVAGFDGLDEPARAAGVLAVSGASSVPGLSSTVVDSLVRDIARTTTIDIAIAPGNKAPRGLAVIAAILGYAGKPVRWWHEGRPAVAHGWQDLRRCTLRLPDGTRIGPRWLAVVDVPDLVLFPRRYDGVRTVAFHAGLELKTLHFGLWALSWPVRWRLVPSLRPLAPLALRIAGALGRFGSDRGGMSVTVSGETADGRPIRRRWTLIAGSGHGPMIPCLPAVILARKLADGTLARTGATPCLGLFGLDDFRAAIGDLDIRFAEEAIHD
ncbi:MAG: saccharopine dehydrogenase NADP-binding domain-containing protein [Alphaproteobacteria bacterium]